MQLTISFTSYKIVRKQLSLLRGGSERWRRRLECFIVNECVVSELFPSLATGE